VFHVSNVIKGNTYTEINQHYNYITLLSGPPKDWEQNTRFSETCLRFVRRERERNTEHEFKIHSLSQLGKIARILH